ncbi:MAG TPA: cytochrome c [Bacteroidia bacterium]|nr:cytochrome c [Bacteroidia bacterium]
MKKLKIIFVLIFGIAALAGFNSCAPSGMIAEKGGAQLWGENCSRCHNPPSMDQYSAEQWTIITDHMRIRANITAAEMNKIKAFLQGQVAM